MTSRKVRRFVSLTGVSRHLYCRKCNNIFFNPYVLPECGHTFCKECIIEWSEFNKNCPLCQQQYNINSIQSDLLAKNMIEELDVLCCNSHCPWKGKLVNLDLHLKECKFDPEKLQNIDEKVKSFIFSTKKKENTNSEFTSEDKNNVNLDINFNANVSLRARIFNRNQELVTKVLSKDNNANNNDDNDFLNDLLDSL